MLVVNTGACHMLLSLLLSTTTILAAKASFLTQPSNSFDLAAMAYATSDSPQTSRASNRKWGIIEPVSAVDVSPDSKAKCFRVFLRDDGEFPNNSEHPVIIAQSAFDGILEEGKNLITQHNMWTSPWVWGIFSYHHYHSTAWELLLCVQGEATIQLGGPSGPTVVVKQGDLVLVPPGVAHKQLADEGGFSLLGSYPKSGCSGSTVDTLRGAPTDQQRANIIACQAPTTEPVLGLDLSQFY